MAVEGQENRPGTKLSLLPIPKAAQNAPCHLLAVRSPPYRVRKHGSQTFVSFPVTCHTRGGPACCRPIEVPLQARRPRHLTDQSCLWPHPDPRVTWFSAQSDHALAWTSPRGGASWTPLLLHQSGLFSVSLWWGSNVGITDLRRGSWEGASSVWGWTLCVPRVTSAGCTVSSAHSHGDLDTEAPLLSCQLPSTALSPPGEKRSHRLTFELCGCEIREDVLFYI